MSRISLIGSWWGLTFIPFLLSWFLLLILDILVSIFWRVLFAVQLLVFLSVCSWSLPTQGMLLHIFWDLKLCVSEGRRFWFQKNSPEKGYISFTDFFSYSCKFQDLQKKSWSNLSNDRKEEVANPMHIFTKTRLWITLDVFEAECLYNFWVLLNDSVYFQLVSCACGSFL